MARLSKRGGSKRIMKKRRMDGPVEDHIEEIKKVAAEIIGEHKEIIVFLPDDESLENLPSDFSYDEENIRNFIHNHVYAGDIDTILFMKPNTKLSLKSLNGTELTVEMKKKNKFVNGMQIITPGFTQEKDGSKAKIYMIRGFIAPGMQMPAIKKYKEKRINPKKLAYRKAFSKYLKEELKKGNNSARDRSRAMIIAKKKANEEVLKK